MSAAPAGAPLKSYWLWQIDAQERRTFWACCAGWGLDALDFMLFPLAVPALMAAWDISRGQIGQLGSATLLLSALGGWLAGLLCDRIGRVRTLQLSVLWFAVFTFASGLTRSYGEFFACRALMGLGFGGEWAAGAVLMGETIRAEFRGRAVGTVQSAWALGWGAAVLIATACMTWLPAALAWRAMFLLGLLPALLVLYLRRRVPEPALYLRRKAAAQIGSEQAGILGIFQPPLLRTTVLAALLACGAQGGYYALAVWLPSFLRGERQLSVLDSGLYLAVIIAGAFAGYLLGAHLSDCIGRRRVFYSFSAAAVVVVLAYTHAPLGNGIMLLLGFPLGFCSSGYFSALGPFLTELYPTALRGSGQGFCYNFGRGIGALFPALVGTLGATLPLCTAIAGFAAGAYALMFVAALLLPETAGRELQ
jgi:MFS family permease